MIRIIDFETSHAAPPEAEVCEYAHADLDPASLTIGLVTSSLCHVSSIHPGARAVHHIAPEDTIPFPPFDPEVLHAPGITAFAAHNASFEAQFFEPPLNIPLLCTYKAALHVWPEAPSHSNGALFYWLWDQKLIDPERSEVEPAHRAGPDVMMTAHILKILLRHATLPELIQWTSEPRAMPTVPIGKYRGQPWSEADRGYLRWMTNQRDMDPDIVHNARKELDRRKDAA